MNLGSLTTFTAQFAGDVSQTRYSGQYTNAINQAQTQFALDTKCVIKDDRIDLTANDYTYSLPADFIIARRVLIDDDTNASGGALLTPINETELAFYRKADWTEDTGKPTHYFISPWDTGTLYNAEISFYPNPDKAYGTILNYVALPTDLSSASDIPFNSQSLLVQFHLAVAYYAAFMLLQGEPSTPEMEIKKNSLLRQYQDKVTEAIDMFGDTKNAPIRLKGGRTWL